MKEIKITGEWDGQRIWREKTAEELLAEALKSKLSDLGYGNLALSAPSSYRSNAVDGVEYSPDQKKLQEMNFFYFKHKIIVIELTLAAIPTKK